MPIRHLALLVAALTAALAGSCPGAGQDGDAEDVVLGAAGASAEPVAGGLGGGYREGIRRHASRRILFPSEQLGKAFDHYDMARDGIADLAYVNPGYQPGRFPIIAAGELPFLIVQRQGRIGGAGRVVPPYAAKEMKDVHVCFAFLLDPGTFHSRHKIVLPEDIKGDKVRPGNATKGAMVTLLGGTNVQSSAPEAREVLERGVANTIGFPVGVDHPVRHRQGGEVPHGRAAVLHRPSSGR